MHPELSPEVARIMRAWEEEQRRKEEEERAAARLRHPAKPKRHFTRKEIAEHMAKRLRFECGRWG
jgi:hypothetical protein